VVAAFFFYQRCAKEEAGPSIRFVSLPAGISHLKPGDTLTTDITGDTLNIEFYKKGENDGGEYIIIKE